jgi:hypothetical protein
MCEKTFRAQEAVLESVEGARFGLRLARNDLVLARLRTLAARPYEIAGAKLFQ